MVGQAKDSHRKLKLKPDSPHCKLSTQGLETTS